MQGINEIKAANNHAAAKVDAEATTHWIELPTGGFIISVRNRDGDIQRGQIDTKRGAKFLKELANHDGVKAVWQHRLAVCRKYVTD